MVHAFDIDLAHFHADAMSRICRNERRVTVETRRDKIVLTSAPRSIVAPFVRADHPVLPENLAERSLQSRYSVAFKLVALVQRHFVDLQSAMGRRLVQRKYEPCRLSVAVPQMPEVSGETRTPRGNRREGVTHLLDSSPVPVLGRIGSAGLDAGSLCTVEDSAVRVSWRFSDEFDYAMHAFLGAQAHITRSRSRHSQPGGVTIAALKTIPRSTRSEVWFAPAEGPDQDQEDVMNLQETLHSSGRPPGSSNGCSGPPRTTTPFDGIPVPGLSGGCHHA